MDCQVKALPGFGQDGMLNWRPGQNAQLDTYFPEKAVETFKIKQRQTC